jgi:hypothetical protein
MQSQTADIVPRVFADEYLDPLDRPPFLARVEKAGLQPDAAFPKDTSLVKIDRFKLTFESGMVLVGNVEDFKQKVDLPDGNGADSAAVQVRDSVSRLLVGR